jgi:hypothetical protein
MGWLDAYEYLMLETMAPGRADEIAHTANLTRVGAERVEEPPAPPRPKRPAACRFHLSPARG